MTANLLFAVGTLLSWAGWAFGLRAVWHVARLIGASPGVDRPAAKAGVTTSGIGCGVCLLIAAAMPMAAGRHVDGAWRLPLFWFVMPFSAWLSLTCAIAAVVRCAQAWMELDPIGRAARLRAAAVWTLVAAAALWLFMASGDLVSTLKGGISMAPSTAAGLLALTAAAAFAMGLAARNAVNRGYTKAIAAHIALLIGSVIFGIPFVWVVITSFKEDRDMSSSRGIVWIPHVQDTVKYDDPQHPVLEGRFHGDTVQGTILQRGASGAVTIEIVDPANLRGVTFDSNLANLKEVPRDIPIVSGDYQGHAVVGKAVEDMPDGRQRVSITSPPEFAGQEFVATPAQLSPVRHPGLKWKNYSDALNYLPVETDHGLVYLKNTLILVVLSVIGTLLSSSVVAYAFSRMSFPGKKPMFAVLLSTMMLPGAVTLLPTFLIFTWLGWIDTLLPIWVPAFFGSAFNIFLLRQFFMSVPMELEDAAKIDGCSYGRTFWSVMMPQIKPALAVIAIWTFMGAWNNFMGPLIYINSPENMPISYALQLFNTDRTAEPGLIMAITTLAMLPVLALFFFAQRYFIEGVTLSGFGGR